MLVGIFAVKDIQENEEPSFDYQFDFFKTPWTECYCGSSNCKGYLGVKQGNYNSDESEDENVQGPLCHIC